MTREEIKKMLPILQAFADGKTIESRCIKGDKSLWYDDEDLSFNNDLEYRIKPESKYRPFKNTEECWQEMQKHQPFGWVKCADKYFSISAIDSNNNYEIDFDDYTFADGTPFGVKEEE